MPSLGGDVKRFFAQLTTMGFDPPFRPSASLRILARIRKTDHGPNFSAGASASPSKSGVNIEILKPEGPTSLLEGRCSIHLSYGRVPSL
jgi:hypothetical protein